MKGISNEELERVSAGVIWEIEGNNKHHVWIKNFGEEA